LHSFQLRKPYDTDFEVIVEELDLHYRSNPLIIDRPYKLDEKIINETRAVDQKYFQGYELLKERRYQQAQDFFEEILDKNPNHLNANKGMADLYYRNGKYKDGINSIRKNLQMNAYDAEANFLAGNLYRALNQTTNAKEAYGWAARSMEYRSSAFAQIAEIYLIEKKWKMAIEYANKSLNFNRHNFNAHQVLIIANRKAGQVTESKKYIKRLLNIDPLNHFANLESYYLNPINKYWDEYLSLIKNEYPDQVHLELAISYYNRGFIQDALDLLIKLSENKNPMIQLWISFLMGNPSGLEPISTESPEFVFPYRRESIQALEWASQNNDQWEWNYYLALNYWAKDRDIEALNLMNGLEAIPDHGPFYSARAYLRNKYGNDGIEEDLDRSILYDRDS